MAGCPGFLGMTYLHLFVAALITAGFAKYPLYDSQKEKIGLGFLADLLPFVLTLVLLFVLFELSPGPLKYGVFFLFLAVLGTSLQSLEQRLDRKGLVDDVSITVAGIFLAMTALGVYDRGNLLGFGPYLFAALLGLLFARLLLLFVLVSEEVVPESAKQLNLSLSVVGTILFSIFVAYDTQKLKQVAAACRSNPDYIDASLGLYLDIVNLFSNVGDLLE